MYLRPYQKQAVDSFFDYFKDNTGNPICAMPTGTGKSVVHAFFIKRALMEYPRTRILSLTHVKELIEQNYQKLLHIWPTAPVGINSAALDRRDWQMPIILGGIASVVKEAFKLGYIDLLIIDECHLLSPDDETMYQRLIETLRLVNPNLKVIGLTATHFRMGLGYLTNGNIFTDVCYDLTNVEMFNKLIDDCYLCPLIPKQTQTQIDTSDVNVRGGDFVQKELEVAVSRGSVLTSALDEAVAIASNRRSWIVFGAGIANCENITTMLNTRGITTTVVHSKISDEHREYRLRAFKQGHFHAIVSNNILTTGFDHPLVDCIVDLRPTTSVVLHIQKYGRGTRPYYHPNYSQESLRSLEGRQAAIAQGGKRNCLVLDFSGNTRRLGPINDPVVPGPKGAGTGEVPIKLCEECGAYNHISARYCCDCGAEFIFRTKLQRSAGTDDILKSTDPNVKILDVLAISQGLHQKNGRASLRINYFVSPTEMYSTWLNFEAIGFAKHKAHDWWRQHSAEPIPQTASEALNKFPTCRTANRIRVDLAGKYPNITNWYF